MMHGNHPQKRWLMEGEQTLNSNIVSFRKRTATKFPLCLVSLTTGTRNFQDETSSEDIGASLGCQPRSICDDRSPELNDQGHKMAREGTGLQFSPNVLYPLPPLTLQTRFFPEYKVVIFAWNRCSPICSLENSYSFLKTHLRVSSYVMLAAHTSEFL